MGCILTTEMQSLPASFESHRVFGPPLAALESDSSLLVIPSYNIFYQKLGLYMQVWFVRVIHKALLLCQHQHGTLNCVNRTCMIAPWRLKFWHEEEEEAEIT